MKRSNQVLLTTLFLTAVSAYAARAQDVVVHPNDTDSRVDRVDTPGQAPPPPPGYVTVREHHFLFFRWHSGHHHHHGHHQQPTRTAGPPRRAPRTGGFGNAMHKPAHS